MQDCRDQDWLSLADHVTEGKTKVIKNKAMLIAYLFKLWSETI